MRLTLADAGGDASLVFDKFYDTLKATPNSEFYSVLIVWKSVLDQNLRKLEVGKLLIKACEEYRGMCTLKTWNASLK